MESTGLGERPEESGRVPIFCLGAAEWLRGPVTKVLESGRLRYASVLGYALIGPIDCWVCRAGLR